MEEKVYLDKLERRDIKPTAMRLLILKGMVGFTRALVCSTLKTSWIR